MKSIEILIKDLNSNKNNNLCICIDKIKQINEYINKLQINSNSFHKNLDLFFKKAKLILNRIKIKRNQKFVEIRNNTLGVDDNNNLNNSESKTKKSSKFKSIAFAIKKNYSKIVDLVNKLNEFKYIINGINNEKSNDFVNLQNTIKKELNIFKNIILNNTNYKKTNKNYKTQNDLNNKNRSQSNDYHKENEKLKSINKNSENEINKLTNQIINYKKNLHLDSNLFRINSQNRIFKNINNKIKFEKINKEDNKYISSLNYSIRDNRKIKNNNSAFNLTIKKDVINSELEKGINVYKKNEIRLNNKSQDLLNKSKIKIKQYENLINIMNNKINQINKNINNKNREILNLKNENLKLRNELIVNNKEINSQNKSSLNLSLYEEINQKLINDLEKYNNIINKYKTQIMESTNNGINNCNDALENKIAQLNKQIEALSKKNNMNEQKIISMYITYNKIYKLFEEQKITINKLSEEIMNYRQKEEMNKKTNNNYLKQIGELNNNILKINRLIEQKDKLIRQVNIKSNNNNKDEIEGLKTFIFKLQSQLEVKDKIISILKKNFFNQNKLFAEKGAFSSSENRKIKSIFGKKNLKLDNQKLFKFQKEPITRKIKEILNNLNQTEHQINDLRKNNKEIELTERQIRKDFHCKTEENIYSNSEEKYNLIKLAKDKNRSIEINIDCPNDEAIKEKYKELLKRFNMIENQIKILIFNISINNKIRPYVRQICQLLRISAKNIESILDEKDKKKALGLKNI